MSKKFSLLLVVMLIMSVVLMAAPVSAQEGTSMPLTISVTGNGTAYSAPDIAYVSIGVEIMNADVTLAVNEANERVAAVIEAIKAIGVAENDIRTENFNIWRETFYGPEGPSGDGTFRVNNQLRVTVRDTDLVAELLSSALIAGANSINGVQFDIADRNAVESEARAKAVEDARADAEELATLMGVSVGQVIAISDSQSNSPMFANYGMGGGGGAAFDVAAPPVEGGSLAISVSVAITFELIR